jgi:WD40 repeat protein
VHKNSFDCLTLSSDSQYLITGGDNMIKFWDDVNFQVNLTFLFLNNGDNLNLEFCWSFGTNTKNTFYG